MTRLLPPPATLALALSLAFSATPLWAQVAMGGLASTEVRELRIPAQPLGDALNAWARQTGTQIAMPQSLVAGKTAPAVTGRLTPRQALDRLLAGSGLVAVPEGQAVTLRKAVDPSAGTTSSLAEVVVAADALRETARGPVAGYVARRSATATKTDTPLIENPQSVSVITGDEIQDRKADSLDEVLRYTAGVTPNQRSLGSDDASLLRGFTVETTGILQDGLRNSGRTFGATIEPYGLERLEVLRGPASVLYGQIPPGGMVNAVSKRPSADMVREVGVEYGSYNRRQLKADVGGALNAEGTWLYRVTMLGREADTRLDHDRDNRLYIAPALTWQPNADTKLTLLARYQKDNQQYAFPNQLAVPGWIGQVDPRVNVSGDDNRFRRTNKMLGYEFEHRFNDTWSVRQNLRYSNLSNDRTDMFPVGLSEGRTVDRYFWPVKADSKSLFMDTQLTARFRTGPLAHHVLVGLDYARIRNVDRYPHEAGFVEPIDLFRPVYGRQALVPSSNPSVERLPARQLGLYLQDQLKWDRWVVTAGLRHDKVHQSSTTSYLATGERSSGYDQSASATTGRLGATYLFDSGWAPYLSYATSFSPELGTSVGGQPLVPSKGRQVEAGVRYQPNDQKSSYTASVFDLVRQNVTTSAPGNPGKLLQTGEVSSRGLELEARAELTRSLSLIAQYTYLQTKITRSNNGDVGLPQQGAPRHSASVWAKYGFMVGESTPSFVALGVRHLGKMRSNTDSGNANLTNPRFTLLDLAMGFDRGPWRVSLNINNLLNKQALYDCGYLEGMCYRSAERTATVNATYRF